MASGSASPRETLGGAIHRDRVHTDEHSTPWTPWVNCAPLRSPNPVLEDGRSVAQVLFRLIATVLLWRTSAKLCDSGLGVAPTPQNVLSGNISAKLVFSRHRDWDPCLQGMCGNFPKPWHRRRGWLLTAGNPWKFPVESTAHTQSC